MFEFVVAYKFADGKTETHIVKADDEIEAIDTAQPSRPGEDVETICVCDCGKGDLCPQFGEAFTR